MPQTRRWMARFARWHVWLGWLVGVPFILWTATGFAMVLKPIEEVRGEHLRIEQAEQALPVGSAAPFQRDLAGVTEIVERVERGRPIALVTFADGHQERFSSGRKLASVDESEARAITAQSIRDGSRAVRTEFFAADRPPIDFRKPMSAWRVTLADGTHVYVGSQTGRIEAVRTRWWRFYDFMWGIHIMDLRTREDTHNPFVVAFSLLALVGALMGTVLLFRRRKARVT
jgi:hypothetical protein